MSFDKNHEELAKLSQLQMPFSGDGSNEPPELFSNRSPAELVQNQLYSNMKHENSTLEQVNLGLITKLQQFETKVAALNGSLKSKDDIIAGNKDALNKAEHIIRKLTSEMENAKRATGQNERQMNTLKEQFLNLQQSYNFQEKDIMMKSASM